MKKSHFLLLPSLLMVFLSYFFLFPTLAIAGQVTYSTHIAYDGWLNWVYDGQTAGIPGSGKDVQAVRIQVTGFPSTYHIDYQAHVAYDGWLSWVSDGAVAGTTGQAKQMEAIKIALRGFPSNYHVTYRAYVQSSGWQSWVSDGATAGTTGQGKAIEALQIRIYADPPQISSISPTQAEASTFELTINGSNFDSGAVDQIYWKADGHFVGQGTVLSRSSTQLVVREYMTGAELGTYQVEVMNSDGQRSNRVDLVINQSQPQGPQLVSSSPANGATNVSVLNRVLSFTFDQSMQEGYSVTWSDVDFTPSFVSWSSDKKTIYFVFSTDLPAGRTIGWVLNPSTHDPNFRSEAGIPLPADQYSGSFSTTATPTPPQFTIKASVQHYYPEIYFFGINVMGGSFISVDVIGPNISSVWQLPQVPDYIVVSLSDRPNVGDTYVIRIYYDGTFEDKTYSVDGINDNFAWMTSPADGSTISTLTPTFTWQEANNINSYQLIVEDDQGNWLWLTFFPAGTSSCVYNFDGSATASLQSGKTYRISLHTFDANGHQATTQSTFTVQAPTSPPQISSISPTQVEASTFELTINGSNFDSGAVDQIYWKADGHKVGQGTVLSRNSTQLVVQEAMGGAAPGTYQVEVKNSDGQRSNKVDLVITEPFILDGFDYPVGTTGYVTQLDDGDGWYNAQDFGVNNHLGEDWNGEAKGNTDCGDPVYAVSKGTILWARNEGSGWGNVLIIRHQLPDGTLVETLYGHLQSFLRTTGDVVRREQIGTIGDDAAGGACHLHFELRFSNCPDWGNSGIAYRSDNTGWTDPSDFIDAHRPPMLVTPSGGTVSLPDGSASVYFPPEAIPEDTFVYITIAMVDEASVPPPPEGWQLLGDAYAFRAVDAEGTPITDFSGTLEVTMQYDPNDLNGLDEQSLTMFYYGSWVPIPSTVDTVKHTVTGYTNRFTTMFGIFGIPEPSTILLFGMGLIGILVLARRKLKKRK